MQLEQDAQRVRVHDGNDGVDPLLLDESEQFVRSINLLDCVLRVNRADLERIGPRRRAEDAAGRSRQAFQQRRRKPKQTALLVALGKQQSLVAVANTNELPAQFSRRENGPGEHGVEPRHVAAAEVDGNSFGR